MERREKKRRMEVKSVEEARWRKIRDKTIAEAKYKVEEGSMKVPRKMYAQCLLQQKDEVNSNVVGKKGPSPSRMKEELRSFSKGMAKTLNPVGLVYKKVIELKETDNVEDKLMKCTVGVVQSLSIIPNLPEIFFNEGFPSIKIAPMGGNYVLIDDEDPEYIKELVDGNLQWVAAYFDRIKYWSPSDIAEERFVWVRIQGIPLHAWSEESLTTIGNHVGKLISIDEYTLSKECLDVARILVSTKTQLTINEEFILKVKNNRYRIALIEENWRTDPWWLKKTVSSYVEFEVSSKAFNLGDESGKYDGDSLNGLEEEEFQTPFKGVNGINYPDILCVSKKLGKVGKASNGALSNQGCGKQRVERESGQTNGKYISFSTVPASNMQITQEIAQSRGPNDSKKKAHSDKDKEEMALQKNGGLQGTTSSNKTPSLLVEVGTERTKLVTGTKHGRRRKATIQPIKSGGESPIGSLSDTDILYNNRRIKEAMFTEEAKKMLDFGSKLGIQTESREEQILERFNRMEERDKQGNDRDPLR
ncbi:hypothetical protein SLA2020_209950 [Shorea laevis]